MRTEYNFSKDTPLTSSMTNVYYNMTLSVLNTLLVATIISRSPELMAFLYTGITQWVILLSPLVAIFLVTMIITETKSRLIAQLSLHSFAFLVGLSMGAVISISNISSIISAFLGATVLFSTMAFYGSVTKRNLDSLGQFMMVGLIAIIIAGLINLFVGSTVTELVISSIGIIVFLGLTAYDVQHIKEEISNGVNNAEIMGALSLYLNFLNLFLDLLRILEAFED